MAFEIVDGHTGSAHISSDDLAPLNVGIVGASEAVFSWGDDFSLTMSSANAGTLGTGAGMVQGRRFWNKEAASITITSGTSGMKRNDLVVARYAATIDGIESVTPVVLRGTPASGTAVDPAISPGDLKLWRIPIDGISVGTPVRLFTFSPSLSSLGDSVSHGKFYHGSKVLNAGPSATSLQLMSKADVKALIGRDFDSDTDFCTAMNGDAKSNALTAMSVSLNDGALYVCFASAISWGMRINWMLWAAS